MIMNSSSESNRSTSGIALSKRVLRCGAVLTLLVLALNGCASYQIPARAAYHPTKLMPQQDADHAECLAFAKARTGYDPTTSAAQGAAIVGVIGALAGAAGGALLGGGRGAAVGAGMGGILGGAVGSTTEMQRLHANFSSHYSVCMRAKGYIVEEPSTHRSLPRVAGSDFQAW